MRHPALMCQTGLNNSNLVITVPVVNICKYNPKPTFFHISVCPFHNACVTNIKCAGKWVWFIHTMIKRTFYFHSHFLPRAHFSLRNWSENLKINDIYSYPMLRADSRFWLVNNREIWSRISRLTSSAWDIKTKERHWWRHNGDSDRRPLSLPLRYDLVTLCLYDDLGQINVIAGILKLRKRFRMSQILFEHGINSLPLVCWRGYGNLSTFSIAIPRLAFGRAWYCDAACG